MAHGSRTVKAAVVFMEATDTLNSFSVPFILALDKEEC